MSVSGCLLDLTIAETNAASVPTQRSDFLLAAAAATAATASDQLLHCSEPVMQNGQDTFTQSDHVPVERLLTSDSASLATANGLERNEETAADIQLSTTYNAADASILSEIDDALNSYLDSSSEPL